MKDIINNYLQKVLKSPMYVNVIYLITVIYIIFISPSMPKEFVTVYYNIVIQFFLLLFIYVISSFQPTLGIVIMISYVLTITYIYSNYVSNKTLEKFDVVEDDISRMVIAEQDSLLNRLSQNNNNFEGVWGMSVIGRELGLDKG